MSTSPQRRYYYDSKPSSRPTSPPSSAEVRSQAIAKLKRAASLPRDKNGGRPSPSPSPSNQATPQFGGPSQEGHSSRQGRGGETGESEEILSPSPTNPTFDHERLYNGDMSRSASQTSEFHLPTPPVMMYNHSNGSPYSTSSVGTPDWTAMQLAQSYLPSLSPAGLSPSPFGTRQHSSRNTPSPLPTLGDLRTLQRSNSAMARARAMDKLTGGRGASPVPPLAAQDDMTLGSGPSTRLQRSGTVGPRLAGHQTDKVEELAPDLPTAPTARPRLQRSFTVSSTNMGEERRSAVGRRMVERLAERKAAREKEEAEVRQIWEEKRAAAEHQEERGRTPTPDEEVASDPNVPLVHRSSPAEPPAEQMPSAVTFGSTETHTLGIPDRPVSRETMRSNGGPFEYESHLRRSLSSRTARGAVGVVSDSEPDPVPYASSSEVEHLERREDSPSPEPTQDYPDLTPPRPAFVTPSRHVPHSSTSTDGTIQPGQSPSSDSGQSRDALSSMMFVMGGGNHAAGEDGRPESGWPREVEESGSTDWGTPSRLHDLRTPQTRSPRDQATSARSQLSSDLTSEYDPQTSTPHSQPPRESGMSWEEVGGKGDLEVPSDAHYHKTSESMSAKLGRSMKTALRKRSQSRSSADSGGTPTSPRLLGEAITTAVQHFSRRGSESSTSPALPQAQHMSHQPSVSSLAPSLTRSDSVSNSALLQHEGPTHEWMPRRADPHDPRIASSKMSPFPGIAALEDRNKGTELVPPEGPRLLHQASDSVVPTQQRTQPPEPIYALPLPSAGAELIRRESADSAQKRSWLSKAFTSPRSSGSVSRKSSAHDISPVLDDKNTAQMPNAAGPDPFAAPPLPAPAPVRKVSASRATASPSVSIVHEGNEDRMTRFTATPVARRGDDNSTPVANGDANQKTADVMKRMKHILALGPDDPARPEILDDPPRKLVLSTQVLQVVNAHTAKDRFLFLFNDILVIAKPLITQGVQANLDMQYLVKSIVSLDQLHVSGIEPEDSMEPPRHAFVHQFITMFADDALAACRFLVERSAVRFDAVTLASLLYKTPELDKAQLGRLLAGNDKLLKAFIDRFRFTGIPLEDALRVFLISIRMPQDLNDSENLLRGFAHRYFDANRDVVSFDRDLAAELVLAAIQLNDALYGTFGFALPNHAITNDIFISAFHSKDPRSLVPDDLLGRIYSSIRSQPLASGQLGPAIKIGLTPSRHLTKLTYGVWSDYMEIAIPQADPSFRITLLGQGLEFDPPVLDFARDSCQAFRVRGTSLGAKSALFLRSGPNAASYEGLGNGRTFLVERAFMRHTFQLSFMSQTNVKRKYCFSVPDADTRAKWAMTLQKQMAQTRSRQAKVTSQLRQVAEVVSLQVLRDAVIPIESPRPPPAQPNGGNGRTRQGSVSTTYQHQQESDLGPLQPSRVATNGVANDSEGSSGLVEGQTGKELVLLCRQNSLLPGLLELLSVGREDGGRVANGGHHKKASEAGRF